MSHDIGEHNPFEVPDELEMAHNPHRPRWWYASQLRVAGATWSEIAEALGYETATTAQTEVRKAKRSRTKDEMEDIVDLELERLDALQLIAWRTARTGDTKAIGSILQIMNHRMKLLGIEKRPNEGAVTTNNTAIFIGGSEDEYTKALEQAREASKKVIDSE